MLGMLLRECGGLEERRAVTWLGLGLGLGLG